MNDRLRDLFAVPLAEFTTARDALAKELRAQGRDAEAKEVTSLRRPTAPVWAVNQLARRSPAEVEELLDSSERVRRAQLRGASGDELRAAMAEQRAALAKLENAAEQVLRGAGLQASPGALRTVQSTLQAAATGPRELREALDPTGFEALLGAQPAPARREASHPVKSRAAKSAAAPDTAGAAREAAAAKRAARAEALEAKRRAQQQAGEERRRARESLRLERRLRQLETRAAAAERAASEARDAVESARADLRRLRS